MRFQPGEGEGPRRGLLRDCTTGCGTDGALHSTTPQPSLLFDTSKLWKLYIIRQSWPPIVSNTAVQQRLGSWAGQAQINLIREGGGSK